MSTSEQFDQFSDRIAAGQPLTPDEIRGLAASPDILALGMLADAAKRRRHGTRVTFLRVAVCAFDADPAAALLPAARELRLTGTPASLNDALRAVARARAVAGTRTLSGFTWSDVEQLSGLDIDGALEQLRSAGLDAIAELPLDAADVAVALEHVTAAGFQQARLTVQKGTPGDRAGLLLGASALGDRFSIVKAINPLPLALSSFRPTTGYDDVKMVALARLAAPGIRHVQVDWARYGPKLAQVALSFGADDVDGVSGTDEAPEGRRRAPLEEITRNIEAAGFEPVERDGRFGLPGGSDRARG